MPLPSRLLELRSSVHWGEAHSPVILLLEIFVLGFRVVIIAKRPIITSEGLIGRVLAPRFISHGIIALPMVLQLA